MSINLTTISILEYNLDYIFPLSYIKNYLRIDDSVDDEYIISLLKAAESAAEKFLGRSLSKKTIQLSFYITNHSGNYIINEICPINKVISLTIDDRDVLWSFDKLNNKISFTPTLNDAIAKVTLETGYLSSEIAQDVKYAILTHIAYCYKNKGEDLAFIPQSVMDIYCTNRVRVKI